MSLEEGGNLDTDTHRENIMCRQRHRADGHVKTEAETRVMQPQAKDCLKPPEAGRGKERSSPRDLRGRTALYFNLVLPASRTVRKYISVV